MKTQELPICQPHLGTWEDNGTGSPNAKTQGGQADDLSFTKGKSCSEGDYNSGQGRGYR